MDTSSHTNPDPGGHETYNVCILFLGYRFYSLCLSDLWLGVAKKKFFLKEIIHFQKMTYIYFLGTNFPFKYFHYDNVHHVDFLLVVYVRQKLDLNTHPNLLVFHYHLEQSKYLLRAFRVFH